MGPRPQLGGRKPEGGRVFQDGSEAVGPMRQRGRPRRAPVGGQPLPYVQIRHRGQIVRLGRGDRQKRVPRAPVKAPSSERPPASAPVQRQGVGQEALPVPLRPRSDRIVPQGRYTRPIRTGAGFATPASGSPDSTLWPGARLGQGKRESCERGLRGCANGRGPGRRRCGQCSRIRERLQRC